METWKLTSFDLFCLDMVIKGAWVYKNLPDAQALQTSLDAVLKLHFCHILSDLIIPNNDLPKLFHRQIVFLPEYHNHQ